MIVFRLLSVGYCGVLTVLLLVPNPAALLGLKRIPGPPDGRGIHLVLFTLMALFVSACRLPVRRASLMAVLIGYGILTETLQWFVPPRTVELLDYTENIIGVLLGVAIWTFMERHWLSKKVTKEALPAMPEPD
jgi:hypothetical protein